jgi:hypothetical protein
VELQSRLGVGTVVTVTLSSGGRQTAASKETISE